LAKHPAKLRFQTVNLFQTVTRLLEERGLLDKAIAMQQAKGDEALLKAIGPVLKEDKLASLSGQVKWKLMIWIWCY
jgi:hypothetical protein